MVLLPKPFMEKESDPSQEPAPEEPVKSIEDDGKGDGKSEAPATEGIPEELWKVMMDVVLAIYEVRESE